MQNSKQGVIQSIYKFLTYLLLIFSFGIFVLQFINSFSDWYLGPYGDEWVFVQSITKVSYGIDVFDELFKHEGEYRHIFTKLVWAGNYLFANGTNLFTSCVVVCFLLMNLAVLLILLRNQAALTFLEKITIFSVFLLATFGGIAGCSITIPVLATWPIVLSSLFAGFFFIVQAADSYSSNSPWRISVTVGYLALAHFFGAIALATFGHGFLYFLFYALVLWSYRQDIKIIIIFCFPGMMLAYLYMRGSNALNVLSSLHNYDATTIIFNLFYYFFRLLADSAYNLLQNYAITSLLGLIGFILLIFIFWPLVFRNQSTIKQNALYSVLSGMFVFCLAGCALGILGRYLEVNTLYPSVPGRFSILVDMVWASAISLAIIRYSYQRQLYLSLIVALGCALLIARQYQYSDIAINTQNYFDNIVQVEQAMGLHNGYLSELDIGEWANMNAVEEIQRRRGIGGFAIKERNLLGLNIKDDFSILSPAECQITDAQKPTIKAFDNLNDPAVTLHGILAHTKMPEFSSVILVADSNDKIIGFGFLGGDMRSTFGKSLGLRKYYAVAPWRNSDTYQSYILLKNREQVCLLSNRLAAPKRDPNFLTYSIMALNYKGAKNQYLFFYDDRMQYLPHYLATYYVDKMNTREAYTAENVPFDVRVASKLTTSRDSFNNGIALLIPATISSHLSGHKIKIKLLVKQSPDSPAKESALRFDTSTGTTSIYTFKAGKTWQVVQTSFVLPNFAKGDTYLRFWPDTKNQNGALIVRNGMIEIAR